MKEKIQTWLSRIKAINTPRGGIELRGNAAPAEGRDRKEAMHIFTRHLRSLKACGLQCSQPDQAQQCVAGLKAVVAFLQMHHPLLPTGVRKTPRPYARNAMIAIQR